MSQSDDTDRDLAADAALGADLKRVAFEPGMLLGVEATRAEQDYHRRRLNRHGYWLHGSGTVCGLAVSASGDDPGNNTDQVRVLLVVTPGIGIDGLGRQVTVHEPYCIDLGAWMETRHDDEDAWGGLIRDGFDPADDTLWLKVTMRAQDTASALQPVLAHDPNAGTDPVAASRIKDCVLLELVAERPTDVPTGFRPFASHGPLLADVDNRLTETERTRLGNAAGVAREQLALGARLLHLLPSDNRALEVGDETQPDTMIAAAQVLLARVAIQLTTDRELIVNPNRIRLDNLARPFVLNPAALAWLARTADG